MAGTNSKNQTRAIESKEKTTRPESVPVLRLTTRFLCWPTQPSPAQLTHSLRDEQPDGHAR